MTDQPDNELIVLLDDELNEIGVAPKLASHHGQTPLHKAFSCYIFDEKGQFLVTQRALSKKVWPGVWTNSVCGHPAPSESFEDAIRRRSKDELGMTVTDIKVMLPDYRYATPPYEGVVENEFCPVFIARIADTSEVNNDEVEDFSWMSWEDYVSQITIRPEDFSYWAKDQLKHLSKHPLISNYSQKTND